MISQSESDYSLKCSFGSPLPFITPWLLREGICSLRSVTFTYTVCFCNWDWFAMSSWWKDVYTGRFWGTKCWHSESCLRGEYSSLSTFGVSSDNESIMYLEFRLTLINHDISIIHWISDHLRPFSPPHLLLASINFCSYCCRISFCCVLKSWKSSTARDSHLWIYITWHLASSSWLSLVWCLIAF